MSVSVRLGIVAALTALAAAVTVIVDHDANHAGLVVLVGAVVCGELLVLRPPHHPVVPMSYAYMLVVVCAFPVVQAVAALFVAELLAVLLRAGSSLTTRLAVSGGRFVAAVVGLVVYSLIWPLRPMNPTAWLLIVLALAGAAMLLVHEGFEYLQTRRVRAPGGAELAVLASGMLMAIGYRGVGGHESVGLWGVVLFSVPLLAAWYSYERLAVISRTSEQTIMALSVVPELAGLARSGHAARVADLAVQVGEAMNLRAAELDDLRAAALLHHLGHLCLDAPEVRDAPVEPYEVADKGAEILRQTHLAAAGDVLATDHVSLSGQILRLCSAYDDLRADCPVAEAVDRLAGGPGFLYDSRVLDALERVVGVPAGASA